MLKVRMQYQSKTAPLGLVRGEVSLGTWGESGMDALIRSYQVGVKGAALVETSPDAGRWRQHTEPVPATTMKQPLLKCFF